MLDCNIASICCVIDVRKEYVRCPMLTAACTAELSDTDAESAVDSFGKSDFRRVNNKGAFLMGIIRRVKTEGPDRTHRTSDLDRMHKSVRNRLTDLIDKVITCLLAHAGFGALSKQALHLVMHGHVHCSFMLLFTADCVRNTAV